MRNSTLLFLIKKEDGNIKEICLAMKKKGFGVGRWNGVGGKVEEGETVEESAIRETSEEINIKVLDLKKVAELYFTFSNKPDWNQKVFAFLSEKWEGEPSESEEMNPDWFLVKDIPFNKMWPDDIFWLPKVLENNILKAQFTFGDNDIIESQNIEIVNDFD